MNASIQDLPVAMDIPQGTLRQVSWGQMTIEVGQIRQDFVPQLALKEIPSNHCQCPHWGFVLKGRMRLKYPDHEESFQAGDVYYAMPNHLTFFEGGCEYVEFSPTLEFNQSRASAS
ncbi:MAG: hypothetical protein ACM3H7_02625 [Acidobacteriaceae bacterium]